MSSADANFQQALVKFKKRLTKEEEEDFKFTSLEDVVVEVNNIQERQGQRKEMMNLPRIKRFLEAMAQYEKIIEVFLNASAMLCFVWGPMKFCLHVASTWADSFDILLDAYQRLAENIPLFGDYQTIFESNTKMQDVLAVVYEDILEFHQTALRFFRRPAWKQLFRSAWKDFNSNFQHILDDLARHKILVESRANIAQIQEAQASRAAARNSFATLEEGQRKTRHLEVIGWLSAPNEVLDQEAAVKVRSDNPSSGKWLLQDSKMKAWMDTNNSIVPSLWMNGKPGAGKTILASVVVEACRKVPSTATIYFYCSYQDEQRKKFLSVARALIAQLLLQNDTLLPYLHEQCLASGQASLVSSQLCEDILKTCLTTMGTVYIIIDGIDECDFPERKAILSFVTSLVANSATPGKLRALFVSQDENDIKKLLRSCTVLRLTDDHNRSDIETYATKRSQEIQEKFQLSDETRRYIVNIVRDGSDGMFLFAKLVLANLLAQLSVEDLSKELQPGTFPKGFEQAYARIVARVYQNPNLVERETAQRLLGWITCSKRSFKWHELQAAVSMDTQEQTLDFENRGLRTHVKDICGSLIDVIPGDRVQLVHGTAKSFLIHNENIRLYEEEHKLAVLCIQYLLFDCFDNNLSEDTIRDYVMTGHYAFQDYAIMHWVDHLEALIPYLSTDLIGNLGEISTSIVDYFEAYGSADAGEDDIPLELKNRCVQIQGVNFYNQLLLLISSTRKLRGKVEKLPGLGDLGDVISKNRNVLEKVHSSAALEPLTKAKLHRYYGDNWHKCPRHACYYFHDGFPDAVRRDNHTDRHEKPFVCTAAGCTRLYHGFSTEKDLKKHMNRDHPDPANLFPKIKKPAPKHTCDICSKEFTRAHNLKAHKNSHANERPYKCSFCEKAFVRKHDRERHVEKIHPENTGSVGEKEMVPSSQETISLDEIN